MHAAGSQAGSRGSSCLRFEDAPSASTVEAVVVLALVRVEEIVERLIEVEKL